MSSRFFFGLLFIFVFGRMVEYYVETYILHPILQSAVLAIFVAVVFILSGKVSKRYDLLDKKVKMHVWLPSLIGALCLAIFLYEIGIYRCFYAPVFSFYSNDKIFRTIRNLW